jgi:hypothetical protein
MPVTMVAMSGSMNLKSSVASGHSRHSTSILPSGVSMYNLTQGPQPSMFTLLRLPLSEIDMRQLRCINCIVAAPGPINGSRLT